MIIGRSNVAGELANLCVEVRPLLQVLNECGYNIDEVQDSRVQLTVCRGPVLQLYSHGVWADIEFPMRTWEDVNNYFWRDKRRFERKPRFIFNWR